MRKYAYILRSSITYLAIVFVLIGALQAQERVTLNDREFIKSAGKWYEIYLGKQFEVDPTVITVKYKTGVSSLALSSFNAGQSVTVVRDNGIGFIDLQIPSSADPVLVVQAYLNSGLVEVAELNSFGEYIGTPDDDFYPDQWHLHQASDADIDAPEAWDIEIGKPSAIIGIIDLGTNWTHPDLGRAPYVVITRTYGQI